MLSGERTPVIDAARMVEQQRRLGILDELRDLPGESSIGNADSFVNVFSATNAIAPLLSNDVECNSPSKGAACRELPLLRYSCCFSRLLELMQPVTKMAKRYRLHATRSSRCE